MLSKQLLSLICLLQSYLSMGTSIELKPSYHTGQYYNISRIVVIADVHDDLYRFQNILIDAKIIDDKNQWIAEANTVVIQLGDQIDRKSMDNDDIPNKHHFRVIKYTDQLKKNAQNKGSDFVSLVGNHELMNIDKIRKKEDILDIVSRRPVIMMIDNYLFCHGGFKLNHYRILKTYHKHLIDINEIWFKYLNQIELSDNEIDILNALILDKDDSILYTRNLGDKYDNSKLFRTLDIDYMFVGHSETDNIYLKDKVWHLDQMLRHAFDDKIYNYVEIEDGNITIKSLSKYYNRKYKYS